ncbi:MAG TPA: hypothetical protein VGW80_10735 [Solirubrobacterales bacterium]|jgi:hypothetical protein|nr:hypothetical protein [Solirubrobacterales bacterium]
MASGLAVRNGGWIGLGVLAAILLLGLGLRVGEAWDGRAPVYDAQAYAAIAANLSEGDGFTVGREATQPSSNYSPGLPLLVAGLYKATGGVHERLARVVLAVIGALSVLFAYAIGRRLGRALQRPEASEVAGVPAPDPQVVSYASYSGVNSPLVWPALVGALVVAVYPALLEYQGMLMSEPLAAALLSGGVLACLWAWDGGWARWLLPGVLFGTLAMVRPEYLGVTLLVALVVAARQVRSGWHSRLLRAAVFLFAALVLIAPWTIRNAVALDRFVPISTGGGQVLFAGAYLPSDGDPEKVGAGVVAENPQLFASPDAQRLRLEQILARLAHARYPDLETDQALSKLGKEQLWDDISDEPLEYAGFVATKIGRIWSHGPRDVMREPLWEALHWLLVAFGLFGLALLAWRHRWEALLVGTIFLAITALSALLVASPRRVLVLIPLLAALAAPALTFLTASLGSASDRRLTKPGRRSDALPQPDRPDSLSRP